MPFVVLRLGFGKSAAARARGGRPSGGRWPARVGPRRRRVGWSRPTGRCGLAAVGPAGRAGPAGLSVVPTARPDVSLRLTLPVLAGISLLVRAPSPRPPALGGAARNGRRGKRPVVDAIGVRVKRATGKARETGVLGKMGCWPATSPWRGGIIGGGRGGVSGLLVETCVRGSGGDGCPAPFPVPDNPAAIGVARSRAGRAGVTVRRCCEFARSSGRSRAREP